MKITFVQNAKEMTESERVIRAGCLLRKPKIGVWILPPNLSVNGKFEVVDSSTGKDVFIESFDTIDGALLYALGVRCDDNPIRDWDRVGALKDWGNFV